MVKGYSLFLVAAFLALPLSVAAESVKVTISAADCQLLQPYTPESGQDPAYKPGVDVEGNAVAPADLGGGSQFELPESFTFPLEVTPFPDSAFSSSAIRLGEVRVDEYGTAYWNGDPLTDRDRQLVAKECLENSK
ncbi:MAG: hypothetical protein ACQETX_07940 [Pseudomonadota bacterium]